jgi:nucleotide-binding universal stress UspA family protein
MTLSTLLVHLDLGASNERVLRVALDCARLFDASVIALAACQPMQLAYGDGYMSRDGIEQDRAEIDAEMAQVEARSRAVLADRAPNVSFRSAVGFVPLAGYIAIQARSADLIITSPMISGSMFDGSHAVDISDLVMHAGRPVLIVPRGVDHLRLDAVVVAWKDSREARRAAIDALPMLQKATRVMIVEIAPERDLERAAENVGDVAKWLARHGVRAQHTAVCALGDDAAQLDAFAQKQGADVLVAGAFGHSRLTEWIFGGVTRDLLMQPNRCSFVSH